MAKAVDPGSSRPDRAASGPIRPGLLRWLKYAAGGSLPAEYDEWVFHDTTSRTWVLRHLGRAILQLAPVVTLVLVFVPGPFWIRAVGVVAATAMGLLFCLAYMVETTDRRLTNAGYAPGAAEQVRSARSNAARKAGTAQRRAKAAARLDRRRPKALQPHS
jgi:hypothetical protein